MRVFILFLLCVGGACVRACVRSNKRAWVGARACLNVDKMKAF